MRGWPESQVRNVPPVFLIVARAVPGRAREVGHLVTRKPMIAEIFMGEAKQLRLGFFRQLVHLASRQPGTERRPFMNCQLIAGEMIRLQFYSLFQGAPPDRERLIRQAVDEIDRDRFEARRTCDLDAAPGLLRSMPPAEKLQGVRSEGLNPQRQ